MTHTPQSIGRLGGLSTSDKKRKAARKNAKKAREKRMENLKGKKGVGTGY